MPEAKRSGELTLTSKLYPIVTVVVKDVFPQENRILEATSLLDKEVWSNLARDCKNHA